MTKMQYSSGCMICGKPLKYRKNTVMMECSICEEMMPANAACEADHFVCDSCHRAASEVFWLPWMMECEEKDPLKILEEVVAMEPIHMHGPEHHLIVPGALLTAYHNNGGELNLNQALMEAVVRANQVPGGACGYWGACGAAVGAGIYVSVLTGCNPLDAKNWPMPQRLVAACLNRNAEVGGPRCCKRNTRLAIEQAAKFTEEHYGITMECGSVSCVYFGENEECIGNVCPYFPG